MLPSEESLLLFDVLSRKSEELFSSESTRASGHHDYDDYVESASGLVGALFCLLKELFFSSRLSLKSGFFKV